MPLLLDNAPQLLSLLKHKEGDEIRGLTEDQVKTVLAEQNRRRDESKKPENKGRDVGSMLAGEIAVDLKMISKGELNEGLQEQARLYAAAALKDIQTIAKDGRQEPEMRKDKDGKNLKDKEGKDVPKSTPFWNTEAGKDLSIESAALNAAHMARTMALLANEKGDKALAKKLEPSVQAAAELAAILSDPEQAKKLSKDDMHKLRDEAMQGLKEAMEKTGQKLKGPDGKEMSIDAYTKQLSDSMDMAYAANHGKAAAAPIKDHVALANAQHDGGASNTRHSGHARSNQTAI